MGASIVKDSWDVPAIFPYLAQQADFSLEDMLGVFNMGVGMAVIVEDHEAAMAIQLLEDIGEKAAIIGEVTDEAGVTLIDG